MSAEAKEADGVARIVLQYSVEYVELTESLGCVQNTAAGFNEAENAYQESKPKGVIVPIEKVEPSTAVWICDFVGKFGSHDHLLGNARVVVTTFDGSAEQDPPLDRGLGIYLYKDAPPQIAGGLRKPLAQGWLCAFQLGCD